VSTMRDDPMQEEPNNEPGSQRANYS